MDKLLIFFLKRNFVMSNETLLIIEWLNLINSKYSNFLCAFEMILNVGRHNINVRQ